MTNYEIMLVTKPFDSHWLPLFVCMEKFIIFSTQIWIDMRASTWWQNILLFWLWLKYPFKSMEIVHAFLLLAYKPR